MAVKKFLAVGERKSKSEQKTTKYRKEKFGKKSKPKQNTCLKGKLNLDICTLIVAMSDDNVDNTLENIAMAYAEDSPIFVKLSNEYSGDFNKLGEYLKKCVKLMSQLCDDISSTSKQLDEISKHLFHNNSKILFKDDVIFSEVKSLFADTFKGFAISQVREPLKSIMTLCKSMIKVTIILTPTFSI